MSKKTHPQPAALGRDEILEALDIASAFDRLQNGLHVLSDAIKFDALRDGNEDGETAQSRVADELAGLAGESADRVRDLARRLDHYVKAAEKPAKE